MYIKPSYRTEEIKYAVRDILSVSEIAKKNGIDLKYLNIGDPIKFDHHTPNHMIQAICDALKNNENGYAPSSGTLKAIDSIKNDASKKGIKKINDVFVTNGASEAIELVLTALLNKEDNVLTPNPGYPLYTAVQAKLEVAQNPYYLDEKNDWMPDPDDIRKKVNKNTKAIIIINPNNPTGSVASKEVLLEIIKIAQENNLLILADEIYDKIIYDDDVKQHAIASLADDYPVVTFNGLAKSYLAPGFRMGWGILSGDFKGLEEFDEAINKLLRARLCACTPMMGAISAALDGQQSHLDELKKKMLPRRDLTYNMLNDIKGISCVKPKGAFYAFPKLENIKNDAEFVKNLILETGVVVVPGSGFGQKEGTSHFRVVFLPNEEILTSAYSDIQGFMNNYK